MKKALVSVLCLFLCLCLMLTGCSLIATVKDRLLPEEEAVIPLPNVGQLESALDALSSITETESEAEPEEPVLEDTGVYQWLTYTMVYDSSEMIKGSDWPPKGASQKLQDEDPPEDDTFVMITLLNHEGGVAYTDLNRDNVSLFYLVDESGEEHSLFGFNWWGFEISASFQVTNYDMQEGFKVVFQVPEGTDPDTLKLFVRREEQTAAPSGSASLEDLAGKWKGVGIPVEGGSVIELELEIQPDGTGEYVFRQGDYEESYPFVFSSDSDSFSAQVPSDNTLGISSVSGTYTYEDDLLTLHIVTQFSNGGSYEYDAACGKE